jgi:hypothetical protein
MDFYKRVTRAITEQKRVKFVVVGREPKEIVERYLNENRIQPDAVVSAPADRQPTPTLILIDRQGIVRDVWLGLQAADGEQRLLRQIAGL